MKRVICIVATIFGLIISLLSSSAMACSGIVITDDPPIEEIYIEVIPVHEVYIKEVPTNVIIVEDIFVEDEYSDEIPQENYFDGLLEEYEYDDETPVPDGNG